MFKVDVYRSAYGDCTNGGISASLGCLTVICPGESIPANPRPDMVREERRGPEHWALIPLNLPKGPHCGPMFGGNLATTSNAAGNHAPGRVWKIHDRFETPELCAAVSE